MKIRNFTKIATLLFFFAAAAPASATEGLPVTAESTEVRASELQNRLEEIKGLDKKNLSHAEKKVLRREVREIKKELAAISGGVYLSIGAILLIALLLILLL